MNCSSNWKRRSQLQSNLNSHAAQSSRPGWPLISKTKSPGFHHTSHSKAGTSPLSSWSSPLFTPNSSPRSYGWLPTSFLGFLTPLQWPSTIPFHSSSSFPLGQRVPKFSTEDHEGKEGNDWSCSYIGQPPPFCSIPSTSHQFPPWERDLSGRCLKPLEVLGQNWNYLSSLRLYLFPDPDHILRERKATKKYSPFQMIHQGSATRRNSTCAVISQTQ